LRRTLFAALLLSGCDSGASETCVPAADAPTCDPLYEPTFDNFHRQTLVKRCAVAGGGCHAPEGAAAGLVYEDPDASYSALLEGGLVMAPDHGCSTLMQRLDATPDNSMPPGAPLSAAERCEARTWIARGALR